MGYKLVKKKKKRKALFVTVLLQMLMLVSVAVIYFILNLPIFLLLMPILNTLIIHILCKNINSKKIILTWISTCFLLVLGLIYMGVKNSFLGISLLVFIHFYGLTLPYLFYIVYSVIKNRKTGKTGDGSVS